MINRSFQHNWDVFGLRLQKLFNKYSKLFHNFAENKFKE